MSFTANLTPDPETGLGKWTARNFMDTIRTGRHLGRGRPILPPMPIPVYRNFNDEDLDGDLRVPADDPGGEEQGAGPPRPGGRDGQQLRRLKYLIYRQNPPFHGPASRDRNCPGAAGLEGNK